METQTNTEQETLNLNKEYLFISNDNNTFIKRLGELRKNNLIYTLLEGNNKRYCVEITNRNDEVIKEIGLIMKGKTLLDFEGVYFLNKDIVYLLRKSGFKVNSKEVLR